MSISYQSIRTERQCKAATGLSQAQFKKLEALFKESYEELFEPLKTGVQKDRNQQGKLESHEALLFFVYLAFKYRTKGEFRPK
ncbi:MAG: hypothetical protein MK212_21275 [Saprospiraceae bacterium]|nr:hypothetical protein [Saprospiraceae bacterium]